MYILCFARFNDTYDEDSILIVTTKKSKIESKTNKVESINFV